MREHVLANRYLLIERIGEGGMGSVYRALDQRTGQDVAVKLLHSSLCEREHSRRRFAREARAASMLNHPGIVKIIDYGEDERPYLVMELLTGTSLRKFVRKNKPTPARLLQLTAELCEALYHAHSHGIVHRDLKPDNIFINHLGHVKVLDFGLAKLACLPELSNLTRSGTALGTCSYMAPEQATGRDADERSDLYAVGVMLYEFLCGMTPFSADEAASVLYMQVHEEPERPCEVNPELQPELEALILWLMNKNPHNRPQNAIVLRDKIRHIIPLLRSASPITPPDPPASEIPFWEDDHPIPPTRRPNTPLPEEPSPDEQFFSNSPKAGDFDNHRDNELPDAPGIVSVLVMSMAKFNLASLDLPPLSVSVMLGEIHSEFKLAIGCFGGHLISLTGNEASAVFWGDDASLRAIHAVDQARRQVELIRVKHGINKQMSLSAGVFTENVSVSLSQSLDTPAIRSIVSGASRLEVIARGQSNETLISGESLHNSMRCQPLRTIFIKNRPDPVYVYRVLALDS